MDVDIHLRALGQTAVLALQYQVDLTADVGRAAAA